MVVNTSVCIMPGVLTAANATLFEIMYNTDNTITNLVIEKVEAHYICPTMK
jgi:hypothetical protein